METNLEALMEKYNTVLPIKKMPGADRRKDYIPPTGAIPKDAPGLVLNPNFVEVVLDFAEPSCGGCLPNRLGLVDQLRFRPHLGAVAIAALIDEKLPCAHLE